MLASQPLVPQKIILLAAWMAVSRQMWLCKYYEYVIIMFYIKLMIVKGNRTTKSF